MSTNSSNDNFQQPGVENTHGNNDNNTHYQQPTAEDAGDNDVADNQSQQPIEKDETDSYNDENSPLILNEQQGKQQVAAILGNLVPHMNFSNSDAIMAATMAAAKKYLVELPKQVYKRVQIWKEKNPKLFWLIVICIILGISIPVTAHLIGFTAAGVTAGSIAAAIQSGIGSVVAGSGFAIMQSITATGLLTGASLGFAAGVPAVVVVAEGLKRYGWERKHGLIVHSTLFGGSLAAGIHASFGSVVAGSGFAIMQSITATGLLAGASLGFAASVPAVVAFAEGSKRDGWVRRFFDR